MNKKYYLYRRLGLIDPALSTLGRAGEGLLFI